MRFFSPPLLLAATICLAAPRAHAGDAATDWQAILALDAGPRAKPNTQQEARSVALTHLGAQEKALRGFLKTYPADAHAFEAGLRLARLLQIRAGLENTEAPRLEAKHLLDELLHSARGEQRAEVDFARIAYQMRALHRESTGEREQLLVATRRFQAEHPEDRRLARLLTEVASLFDADPETKRALLLNADTATQDDGLKKRIADDLRQLDLLGKPLELRLTTVSGKTVDLAESRGKVVLLIFFAEWSPPAMEAVAKLQRTLRDLPADQVQVLGYSLDNKAEELTTVINKNSISWPVGFDGKGWAGPLVRQWGINTLPTVWLVDQRGALHSLNGLEATADQVLKLLRHPPSGGR